MALLTTVLVIIGVVELIHYIGELISWGNETLPPCDMSDTLALHYKPEACDEKMRIDCNNLLQQYFSEPADLPLYQRVDVKMRSLDIEQRKKMLRELTEKSAEIMRVELDDIKFENMPYMGVYDSGKNVLVLSVPYIKNDQCCIEAVKTIFHELKHAVQFKAICSGGNVWGYSDETLVAWANNYLNYIKPEWDPEGYVTQPIEIDSFGFECSVIPMPGMNIPDKAAIV